MNNITPPPRFWLYCALASLASPCFAAIEVSSHSVFHPSPALPTTELLLENWRTISRTTLGDGRHEIVAAPTVRNANVGQFTTATFTLTSALEGIEIVDGLIEVGTNGNTVPVILPNAALELNDSIALRASAGTFDPEAAFLAGLSGTSFGWTATARELPVVAGGVKVIEHLERSGELPEGNAYEFVIPNTSVTSTGDLMAYANEVQAARDRADDYMDQLASLPNGDPVIALIFVSDPVLRAGYAPGVYPPVEWFPNSVGLSAPYDREQVNPVSGVRSFQMYFNVIFNLDDPSPLYVHPEAFADTGTFVGAFGTLEPPTGPPDTLGDTQGDPFSVGVSDDGVVEPQYWSVRNKELVDGVYFSGQVGMSGVAGRMLLRLRKGQPPHFEFSARTTYGASFRVRTTRSVVLDEQTILISPEEPIPLAAFPIGPIECHLTLAPSLFMGAGGQIDGSAVMGWSENMTSTLTVVIDNGESDVQLSHERTPLHRTGPFLHAESHGQFEAFARAKLNLNLSFNGYAGMSAIGSADALARLTVSSEATPWWELKTGSRADVCFSANVLGIPIAEKCVDLGEVLNPHQQAEAPPDPNGKANAADQHWAEALTYPSFNQLRPADIIPLADGRLLVTAQYDNTTILLLGLNPDGSEAWRKSLGNVIFPLIAARALPDGGALVLAGSNAGSTLMRLDPSHSVVWSKNVSRSGAVLKLVAMDVSEEQDAFSIYLAGDVSAGPYPQARAVVVKLDANGGLLWANTYAVQGAEFFRCLEVTPDGGCVAGGKTDAPWDDTRDPGVSPAFPDDSFNGYLLRVNPDGSARWAMAAVPNTFHALAAHPDGRIGAVSMGHGATDPWRGPGLHAFSDDGELLWATSYAIDREAEELAIGDTLNDGAVSVCTAPGGGFLLANRTGVFPDSSSASHLVCVDGGGNPRWVVVTDWAECPSELPVRVLDRGDSFFLMSSLDGARLNGGDPTDCLFLTCIPDTGLLSLLSANRLDVHNYYKPTVDNFTGNGVLNQPVSGRPMNHTPVVAEIVNIVISDRALPSSPSVEPMFIALSDSVPTSVPPQPVPTLDAGASTLRIVWPADSPGYTVFESTNLQTWIPFNVKPTRMGNDNVLQALIAQKPHRFFRLEQTAPSK